MVCSPRINSGFSRHLHNLHSPATRSFGACLLHFLHSQKAAAHFFLHGLVDGLQLIDSRPLLVAKI
jgi:hypothetical protein